MPRILILGAGMVGSTMAVDLAKDGAFDIAIADRDAAALERATDRVRDVAGATIDTIEADLADASKVAKLAKDADLVLGALSSVIGFQAFKAVIDAGVHIVDISFFANDRDGLDLDPLAKKRGVTAIFDCGIAPGLSNILSGFGAGLLDRCDSIEILVGGIPRDPAPPFNYKAAFSPHDVIEEYTRPARLVEQGDIVTREALSEPEIVRFDRVGDLEAFNTDGLRSMIHTLDVPDMKEKTMRYPGHIDLMRTFRDTGLFSREPLRLSDGTEVRPLDVTAALMFPLWTYADGEADLTIMRVTARGVDDKGAERSHVWEMHDEYDPDERCSSMSRTTAFPATLTARMILSGDIDRRGVLAPEQIADIPGAVELMLEGLQSRGVRVEKIS